MRVLAINGSARPKGNTTRLIELVFEPLRDAGIECELIELARKDVRGCTACAKCVEKKDGRCYGRKDFGNEVIERMLEADGFIFGSPTYFADLTPELKALLDRAFYAARPAGDIHARKPGAAVVAVRRAGAIHTFDSINHYFLISQMLVVGSSYWNVGIGRTIGEVDDDEEGVRTMRRLGENMAFALERLRG